MQNCPNNISLPISLPKRYLLLARGLAPFLAPRMMSTLLKRLQVSRKFHVLNLKNHLKNFEIRKKSSEPSTSHDFGFNSCSFYRGSKYFRKQSQEVAAGRGVDFSRRLTDGSLDTETFRAEAFRCDWMPIDNHGSVEKLSQNCMEGSYTAIPIGGIQVSTINSTSPQ